MTSSGGVRQLVRDRQRRAQLTSERRAGAQSRRDIRQRHRQMLRNRWTAYASTVAVGAGVGGLVHVLLNHATAPYLVGAVAMGTVWACHEVLVSGDGMAASRIGILGEEKTTRELRRLSGGWHFINHVMLERSDIDHAVLGPAGFFAIDSKYRSDWTRSADELDRLSQSVRWQGTRLQPRLGVTSPRVEPVVAMWGPGVLDHFPEPFEHGGVLFCPGPSLAEQLKQLPLVVDQATIDTAHASLDRYVANRDIGEAREHGPPVRSVEATISDLFLAAAAGMVALLVGILTLAIPHHGLWSFAASAEVAALSTLVRQRTTSPRVRRITAFTIATALGWCAFLAALAVIETAF